MYNVVSKFFLVSLKLEILTDPVNDREHAGAAIVVKKTLICSPEFTCTIFKNKSVAGIKKAVWSRTWEHISTGIGFTHPKFDE